MSRGAMLLAIVAGLMGAAGVSLAAVAAHKLQLPALASGASMLQIHAVAGLAVAAVVGQVPRPLAWLLAGTVMLAGAALFAATVSLPAFGVFVLPARAAPVGGSLTILGWILVAVAASVSFRRG